MLDQPVGQPIVRPDGPCEVPRVDGDVGCSVPHEPSRGDEAGGVGNLERGLSAVERSALTIDRTVERDDQIGRRTTTVVGLRSAAHEQRDGQLVALHDVLDEVLDSPSITGRGQVPPSGAYRREATAELVYCRVEYAEVEHAHEATKRSDGASPDDPDDASVLISTAVEVALWMNDRRGTARCAGAHLVRC